MEYSWLFLFATFSVMALFIITLYFKIGVTGLVVSEVATHVEQLPPEVRLDRRSLLMDLGLKYETISSYLKDSFIAVLLILTTVVVKLLGYDIVWAPFWGSIAFCGFLIKHYFTLDDIQQQVHRVAESIQQQIIIKMAVEATLAKGLKPDEIPQPDFNLTRNKDFDING